MLLGAWLGSERSPEVGSRSLKRTSDSGRGFMDGVKLRGEHEAPAQTLDASQGHERMLIRVTTMTQLDHWRPRRADDGLAIAKLMAGVFNQYGTRWPREIL